MVAVVAGEERGRGGLVLVVVVGFGEVGFRPGVVVVGRVELGEVVCVFPGEGLEGRDGEGGFFELGGGGDDGGLGVLLEGEAFAVEGEGGELTRGAADDLDWRGCVEVADEGDAGALDLGGAEEVASFDDEGGLLVVGWLGGDPVVVRRVPVEEVDVDVGLQLYDASGGRGRPVEDGVSFLLGSLDSGAFDDDCLVGTLGDGKFVQFIGSAVDDDDGLAGVLLPGEYFGS